LTTQSSSDSPVPRPSATVVLLRDGPDGPELLLTVRPKSMRFMGGAAVFVGGAVSQADLDPRWERASRLTRAEAAGALGLGDPAALGSFVCALREAFEEVGLLLGSGPLERVQRSASDDPERWLEHCLDLGVVLGTDLLIPAGRWVTPHGAPIRFETWFFATRVPDGWEPRPDPAEVEACFWKAPRRALEDLEAGRLHMASPTIEVLHRLEGLDSVEEVMRVLSQEAAPRDRPWVTRLHPVVRLVLAPNAGIMTGPGTNTYIVGLPGTESFVIDPAVDDESYLGIVAEAAGVTRGIIVTHRHSDHIGGVARLAEVTEAPVYAFGNTPISGLEVVPLTDGDTLAAGQVELVVLHTPGHASDHICLRLEDALFSGDTLLGEGTAVIPPPDGDMRAYLRTLRRLQSLPMERVFPGHFRARNDARALIEGYLDHRAERDRAIIAAVGEGGATIDEVVRRVYSDTPPDLHPLAAYSVKAHLEMAEEDGRVTRSGDLWVRLPRPQVPET
jgi:glyoxylase-like metal-dependent hydrolase (beta-lactamase superfamily II)/8-oxo-dGTP pyrophosphatase MutT (NUDIX family)